MSKKSLSKNQSKIKLAIVGSRDINDFRILDLYGFGALNMMGFNLCDVSHIVSGGAVGVDRLAEKAYRKYKDTLYKQPIRLVVHKAEWETYGKQAGFLRNQIIVDDCDAAIVIWNGGSSGTRDTIEKLSLARKPYILVSVLVLHNPIEFVVKEIRFIIESRWRELYEEKIHSRRGRAKSRVA